MSIEKKKSVKGNYNTYKDFRFMVSDKEQKKIAPKVGVDSNGNTPIDGQVSVEEALEEAESKDDSLEKQIVEATGCTKEIAKSSVAYAKQQDANNIKAYAIASINKGFTGSNLVNGINPLKFNNFEPREYDYDSLEKKLLGWDNTNLEEVEEIQESTGYDFLKKYGIGSAIVN